MMALLDQGISELTRPLAATGSATGWGSFHRWWEAWDAADVGIRFDAPLWLLAIPILVGLILIPVLRPAFGHARTLTDADRIHIVLRVLVILLAGIALAQPQWTWTARATEVVLVRDISESIPAASAAALDQMLAAMPPPRPDRGERLGEVVVAEQAEIRRRPESAPLAPWSNASVATGIDRGGSRLSDGIATAESLRSPSAGLRILLASDGNETNGSLLESARGLAARSVPVDVLPLPSSRSPWSVLRSFEMPAYARPGSTVDARVEVESDGPFTGTLRVVGSATKDRSDGDGDTEASEPVTLEMPIAFDGGRITLRVPIAIGDASIQRFDARLVPDTTPQVDPATLRATALTIVERDAQALVIAPAEADPRPLVEDLSSRGLRVDVATPANAPTSVEAWSAYDLVALVGVSAEELGRTGQEQLAIAVEDLGSGLLVTGGRFGFARDWQDGPLESLLPVSLRLPEHKLPSRGAVAIVLDRSGSMSSFVANTGRSQQDLAADAAIAALGVLTRVDLVTVIAFDGSASVVVPLRQNNDPARIAAAIRSIAPGGGTDAFRGIEAAAGELERAPVAARHMILLSDGNSTGDHDAGVRRVDELRRRGISVSTVSIGDGAADALLARLANAGGGRFHRITSTALAQSLPEVLRRETEFVRRAPIREGEPFELAVTSTSGPFAALAGAASRLPPITGYGVVADRDGPIIVGVRGPESDPIAAAWNRGVGRVAVFTSDPLGPWGTAWRSWSERAAYWTQLARWTTRQPNAIGARVQLEPALVASAESTAGSDSHRVVLSLEPPAGGQPVPTLARVRVVTADGARSESALEQVGALRFEGMVAIPQNAVGQLVVTMAQAAGEPGLDGKAAPTLSILRRGFVTRSLGESAHAEADEAMLRRVAALTGGRVLPLQPPQQLQQQLFDPTGVRFPTWSRPMWDLFALLAAILFLGDAAARRLMDPQRRVWSRAILTRLRTTLLGQPRPSPAAITPEGAAEQVSAERHPPTKPTILAPSPSARPDRASGRSGEPKQAESPLDRLREAKRRAGDRG